MKIPQYLLAFFCFVVFSSHAQESSKANERLFDEFTISLNRTTSYSLYGKNVRDGFGFGLGARHGFRRGKTFTPLFGIEYNFTSQHYSKISSDKYMTETDVRMQNHYFSLPVDFRFNTATKNKFFFQAGIFVDFNFITTEKGNYVQSNPYWLDSNAVKKSAESKGTFKHNYLFSSFPNAGFSGGLGVEVPFSKINMLIRADYKFGLVGLLVDGTSYLGYARLSFGIILHEKKKK